MTKADIVNKIAEATGLTKVETEAVVNGFISIIRDTLIQGEGIEIRGFGTFKIRKKNPRVARNPRTGEKIYIPKKFVPYFKPSRDFKILVDNSRKIDS
ncbi:integration host factor subunit beta [candidate division KSB1 bacterium]|nr:MAG: integration host factor subunit beta [candidate division KSB1 bacterium]